jgi:hypothetical protein
MPTLLNSLRREPEHSGQTVRASSLKDWRTSKECPQDWQA